MNALRMAVRSIRASRMRSVLTMLGVVIGVSSVILLVGAGHATRQAVESKLEALGTNVLTVYPGGNDLFSEAPVVGDAPLLTDRDVAAVKAVGRNGGVADAFAVLAPQVRLRTGAQGLTVGTFSGAAPGLLKMTNARFAAGRGYTAAEERDRARVMVLGSAAATRLFGGPAAVGQPVVANGVRFVVVGVLRTRGGDRNADNAAYAPYSSARDSLSGPTAPLTSIAVQTTSRAATRTAKAPIAAALRRSHRLTEAKANDFSITDQASLLGTTSSIQSVLKLVLAGVAATSLLIGGLGVMNIMLVTVIERTREIGIRKAIGARRSQIVSQFLIEAVVLCLMGGVAGIALGLTATTIASGTSGYDAAVGPSAIVLALGVSVAVGLFFGYYPANKAASLRPIDALRYE